MASVVTNRISSSTADVQSTQRCGPARSASRASQAVVAESNVRLIYIAPLPIARLEGLHHGMSRLLEVLVGVLTGRRIAAADVSAAQTFAQLHPTLARLETFLAALSAGRDIGIGLLYVLTLRHEPASKRYLPWMNRREGQIPAIQRAGSQQRIEAAAQSRVYNGLSRRIAI